MKVMFSIQIVQCECCLLAYSNSMDFNYSIKFFYSFIFLKTIFFIQIYIISKRCKIEEFVIFSTLTGSFPPSFYLTSFSAVTVDQSIQQSWYVSQSVTVFESSFFRSEAIAEHLHLLQQRRYLVVPIVIIVGGLTYV